MVRDFVLYVAVLLFTFLHCSQDATCANPVVRITNLKCKFKNLDYGTFSQCNVERMSNETRIRIFIELFQLPIREMTISVKLFRKQPNGYYTPFLVNVQVDWCDYLNKRNNPLLEHLLTFITKYTNIDKVKCPIYEKLMFVNLTTATSGSVFSFRLPGGDYHTDIIGSINGVEQGYANIYAHIG